MVKFPGLEQNRYPKIVKKKSFFFFLFFSSSLFSFNFEQMTSDLERIAFIHAQKKIFPNNFNFLYSTGYFVTPSARMASEGLIGFGYANFFPYSSYNVFVQPFSFLELSANWRMFHKVEDELTKYGHGDLGDREANVKISILNPADDENYPFVAVGIEDFMGTKRFMNGYLVLTKYFGPSEISLGWGYGTYHLGATKGFFGAFSFYPFLFSHPLISPLTFSIELDPKDYTNPKVEPHPLARSSSMPINFGVQYNYRDLFQFSLGYLRGKEISGSAAISYNWGHTKGFLPKLKDPPLFYNSYTQSEILRTFFTQGLRILSFSINEDTAFISLRNERWVCEHKLRERLAHLLYCFPYQVERFIVVIYAKNLPCQSYLFCKNWLSKYCKKEMGTYEFNCLTAKKEPCKFPKKRFGWGYIPMWVLSPRLETFLGGAKGKFKYDLGLKLALEGDLPYQLFYEAAFTITALSTVSCSSHYDYYNPSHLPNVATDYILYRTGGSFSTDILYLQCANAYSKGIFTRLALGYFQVNYAGVAGEMLWYPAQLNFAIGIEGALLKKRNYHGLGFQSTLPILKGCTPSFVPYTILSQYFLDFYFDLPQVSLFAKISLGQFLAHDKGAYFELTRIFPSGLRLTAWASMTNAHDQVHGLRYFDRGVKIEIPLELFYKRSSRRVFNYGMAAWLRDAGYRIDTGKGLFEILNRERRF